jgi:hypothetical protein
VTRPARIAAALAATAVAGWLGLGLVQSDSQRRAEDILLPLQPLPPERAREASRLLDRAAFANPDAQPDIDRGILAVLAGHPRRAERTLLAVTRREPDNIAAWAWIDNAAARSGNTALRARVRAQILRIRPPVNAEGR